MTGRAPRFPLIGNVTYNREETAFEDVEMENKRRRNMQLLNRAAIRKRAIAHLRRIASEHGLANSISQFFDKRGRPPPHITIASMMRQYRQMEKQEGWLSAINAELRARLKELNHVRYMREAADLKSRMRHRAEERAEVFGEAAREEDTPVLAPKLAAAVREAIQREIAPKEVSFLSVGLPHDQADMLSSRQIQKMMKFLFYDYLPEGDRSVPEDPDAQYEYLAAALNESESQRAKLQENMYELREFIESADLVTRGKDA